MKLIRSILIAVGAVCALFFFVRLFVNEPSEKPNEPGAEIVEEPVDTVGIAVNSHLKFKGVPIDGSLKTFVDRMKNAGFQYSSTNYGIACLEGDFAGFKNCQLYVSTVNGLDVVSHITVLFPTREQWRLLYDDYTQLKQLLTEKYGKPAKCTERFQHSYYADDDFSKFHAVLLDQAIFESVFRADNGKIALYITNSTSSVALVALEYFDAENNEALREHAIDDL
ncbi:MAG: hypothetical protein ACI4A8_03060 [Muribaculaceae bacterium]